jgi:hypothetical protein
LVPAAVVGVEPAVVIRLPQGIVIELASASPQWVAALARELTRPAT